MDKLIILKSLEDAISKCGPTIKQRFERFNEKDYNLEEYSPEQDPDNSKHLPENKYVFTSPVGRIQQIQEDLQDKVDYNIVDIAMAEHWSLGESMTVNNTILQEKYPDRFKNSPTEQRCYSMDSKRTYRVDHWDELHPEDKDTVGWYPEFTTKEVISFLDDLIKKSPELQENCVLYRCGSLPTGLKVGDAGVLDCFSGCSFNPYVAEKKIREMPWVKKGRYNIRIFAPKGIKGFVPYEGLDCEDWQSEFVLGRGQKFILLSRNTKTKPRTADILLY